MDKIDTEDFNNALQRHGFNRIDFDITENDTTQWHSNEVVAITGTISITLKSTGKSKEYHTGMGTKWVSDFEDDLAKGVFK